MRLNPNNYLVPAKFYHLGRAAMGKPLNVLEVGCANGAISLTRRWLPNANITGIDIDPSVLKDKERSDLRSFHKINLECDKIEIGEEKFDLIIMCHVVEHLKNGLQAVSLLSALLVDGGNFYIEFPSQKTLNMPRGLNFSDDPTHVRVYSVAEVANAVMAAGLRVKRAGTRRIWQRVLLSPLAIPYQIRHFLMTRCLHPLGLWDLLGWCDFVLAEKRS